jgi:hypothetical protein
MMNIGGLYQNNKLSILVSSAFFYLCMCFSNCSVPVKICIRNLQPINQKLTVQLQYNYQNDIFLQYVESIEEPSFNIDKLPTNRIKAVRLNENTFVFDLPSESTFFIESTINFHSFTYKSIKIGNEELLKNNYIYSATYFKSKKELLNEYTLWFDIK